MALIGLMVYLQVIVILQDIFHKNKKEHINVLDYYITSLMSVGCGKIMKQIFVISILKGVWKSG